MLIEPKWKPFLKNTRHVIIASWLNSEEQRPRAPGNKRYKPGDQEYKWVLMGSLIGAIPCLQTLDFEAHDQVPLLIIEALAKQHPKVHLYVRNWTRINHWQDHTGPAELALANSPNLRSIHCSNFGDHLYTTLPLSPLNLGLPAFNQILALAPNLQELEISPGLNTNCTINLTITAGMMRMEEYRTKTKLFKVDRLASTLTKNIRWQGIDFLFSLLDGNILDLSKLETLDFEHFIDPTKVQNLLWGVDGQPASLFPRIKHLSIVLYRDILRDFDQNERSKDVTDFISSLPHLESLSLKLEATLGRFMAEYLLNPTARTPQIASS
jgi:hypothetical protein